MNLRIRILTLLVLALLAVGLWHFWYIPWSAEKHYERGYAAFGAGQTDEALDHLTRAHALNPDMSEANMLMGWIHWRVGRVEEAERHFGVAFRENHSWFEAADALATARLAMGRPELAIEPLERAADLLPRDLPTHLRLGEAYRRTGRNADAVELYRGMLQWNPPSHEAERALLEIFGLPRIVGEVPSILPPRARSSELQLLFRTEGDHFQARDDGAWRTTYLTGVNLGPARPGEWAVSASLDFRTYREWFQEIEAMGANTVRAYTILPPAFYQALKVHNEEASDPLWLIQEVWLDDETQDLYEPATRAAFKREVVNAIDMIHGQGDIRCRPGHYCGLFTADVSSWVLGLALGREVEPSLVLRTNAGTPERTSYQGEYVSLEEGHPTEAWFAEMMDLAARYETETYNAQRPLTVVNWPPLDPTHQPTEATQEEEIRIRRELGEVVAETVREFPNDMNAVSLPMTRFNTEPAFRAGLFALYHVYQHWPDFLFLEPSYAEAQDEEGPNRYLGYLQHLKEYYPDMPLLIGEYGVASSFIPVHLHPQGWHNGGLTEAEQAELLVRFSRNIRDTNMAGGIVFAWLDEWWKQVHDEFTAPLEPRENDPLWLNALDPEEYFGLVGYRPFQEAPLLRGEEADWEGAQVLYSGSGGEPGTDSEDPDILSEVHATSDYAYVYLRLDLRSDVDVNWDRTRFLFALNTLPGEVGSTAIPGAGVSLESGAGFLVRVGGTEPGQIQVAADYNPWGGVSVPGRPDMVRIQTRRGLSPELGESDFEDMVIEANRARWARDGREFPSLSYNRSTLPFGTADPDHPEFSSHAAWHLDRERRMVEIRIPWGLLLVMDPANQRVFSGTDPEGRPLSALSPGIAVSVFALEEGDEGPVLLGSLPEAGGEMVEDGQSVLYTWEPWQRVRYRPYFKPAYHALRELWSGWTRFLN